MHGPNFPHLYAYPRMESTTLFNDIKIGREREGEGNGREWNGMEWNFLRFLITLRSEGKGDGDGEGINKQTYSPDSIKIGI